MTEYVKCKPTLFLFCRYSLKFSVDFEQKTFFLNLYNLSYYTHFNGIFYSKYKVHKYDFLHNVKFE